MYHSRRGCVKSRKWYAPKGQKLLAQGSALGVMHPKAKRPVRAKAFIINAFALTGRIIYNVRLEGVSKVASGTPRRGRSS